MSREAHEQRKEREGSEGANKGKGDFVQGANVLTPTGGTPARLLGMLVPCGPQNEKMGKARRGMYLSLQFPGWPTVPVQRMMIFVVRESPAQKFLSAAAPRHWNVPFVLSNYISSYTFCWKVSRELQGHTRPLAH